MAHAWHDDAMVPVDVYAVGDLNGRSTWGGARCYVANAAVLDGYGIGFAELTADEVDVVDDQGWVSHSSR